MSHDTYQLSLPLRTPEDGDPQVADLLQEHEKAIGMVPNMYAAMANLPALLKTYSYGYERFRKTSGFTPAEQEIVFLTVSRANSCTYCVAAHSMLADTMAKVPKEATDAIRNDEKIADEKLETLRRFTQLMVKSGGNPSSDQAQAFLAAGYSETQILAIILAIGVKVLSNYTNHVFHTEVDPAFAGRRWASPQKR